MSLTYPRQIFATAINPIPTLPRRLWNSLASRPTLPRMNQPNRWPVHPAPPPWSSRLWPDLWKPRIRSTYDLSSLPHTPAVRPMLAPMGSPMGSPPASTPPPLVRRFQISRRAAIRRSICSAAMDFTAAMTRGLIAESPLPQSQPCCQTSLISTTPIRAA